MPSFLSARRACPWCLTAILLAAWLPAVAAADDPVAPADPPNSSRPKDAPPDSDEAGDRYRVPDGSVDELKEFMIGMLKFEPKTRRELVEHQEKGIPSAREAAARILKLEKDTSKDVYKMAWAVVLQIDMQDINAKPNGDHTAVVNDTLNFVKLIGDKAGGFEVDLLMMLGETLQRVGDKQLAAKAYLDGGELLAKSKTEEVAEFAKMVSGMGRRLNLPGSEMKVVGVTTKGDKFDLKSLRGKVVLVDFWATWCGPCMQELPGMERNYERFHKLGFEIVGISIDESRDALDGFLEKRQLPWPILHDEQSEGGHPSATYYGISSIPSMFLIDREGKVVSTEPYGGELTKLLEGLFPNAPAAVEE